MNLPAAFWKTSSDDRWSITMPLRQVMVGGSRGRLPRPAPLESLMVSFTVDIEFAAAHEAGRNHRRASWAR